VEPLTYVWVFGDGSTPGTGAAPQHDYKGAGTFSVTLQVTNSKGADLITKQIKVTQGAVEFVQ
jgi:PKD repeat protein